MVIHIRIMEHITTKQGVEFVLNGGENVGGTITPQHLLYNRNRIQFIES